MFFASTILAQSYADLILTHGKIWTGNPGQPQAEAVAMIGSRIVAVGPAAEVRKWVGTRTEVIDLAGKLVVPGFNDAHVHFYTGGAHLASVKLRDAKSEAEFRERIRQFAAKLPHGRWILGGDWDHENWTPARLPTRQLIDEAAGDHPVFINRLDGHMSLANSLALQLGGVTRETLDPPGGHDRTRRFRRAGRSSKRRGHDGGGAGDSGRPRRKKSPMRFEPPCAMPVRTVSPACRICRRRPRFCACTSGS